VGELLGEIVSKSRNRADHVFNKAKHLNQGFSNCDPQTNKNKKNILAQMKRNRNFSKTMNKKHTSPY
jgi:hypothetical protein